MSDLAESADGVFIDAACERQAEVEPPLRLPLLLGYGVGQTGAQIFRDVPSFLLPAYLSTALGVPAWMMGMVIFFPKLWIVFCDPLVGAFSDRVKTRIGRRRPFLLAGAILCPITLILLLNAPLFTAVWARAAYVCLMFTLAMSAFSLFSVPYLALGAEVSADPVQRTRLMSYRLIFVGIGLFTSIGIGQRLLGFFGGGRAGYSGASLVLAAICAAAMMLCFFMVRVATPRLQAADAVKPPSFFKQLGIVRGNRPFMLLLAAHYIHLSSQAGVQTVTLLFFIYIGGHPDMLLLTYMIDVIAIMLSQPIWLWLTRRISKDRLFLGAVLLSGLTSLSFILQRPDSDILVSLPLIGGLTAQDIGVFARFVMVGFTASGMTLLSYALFTDTVDAFSVRTRTRYEGAFAGVWSAVEKVGFASGPLLVGAILSLCGFVESTQEGGAQTPRVIQALYFGYAVLPAILLLLSTILIRKLTAVLVIERGKA